MTDAEQIEELYQKTLETGESIEELLISYLKKVYEGNLYVLDGYGDNFRKISEKFPEKIEIQKFQDLLDATKNYFVSNCELAAKQYLKLLPPHHSWNNKELDAVTRAFAGGNYRSLSQYDKAIEQLLIAKSKINPDGELSGYLMMSYYHLSEVHIAINELEQAEKLLLEGLNRVKLHGSGSYRMASGLANISIRLGKFEEAKRYIDAAIGYAKTIWQEARAKYDYALYYFKTEQYENSIALCDECFDLRMKNELYDAANTCRILKANTLFKQNKIEQSKALIHEALEETIKYPSPSKIRDCHLLLSEISEVESDWENAFKNFKKYQKLTADLHQNQQKEIFKMKNTEIQKQKEIIEEIHEEITDSIKYAKRIQSAILPPDHLIKKHLPNSFVLYKPKDIVAGDFYWMEISKSGVQEKEQEQEQEREGKGSVAQDSRLNTVLIAAADCTGHGVPGAMVSVVCNNGLNRSVREFGLTDPGKILDKTRELVIQEFEKSEEEVKDGMDIALLSLEQVQEQEERGSVAVARHSKLSYAGAHNPLWIIRKGAEEVEEIKANKQPIGKFLNPEPYNTHQLELNEGDTVYVFSDGYADQFGGEKGKKLKTSNFKKFLLSIQDQNMEQQKQSADDFFENWRGVHEQLDDVCVIGIRI